MSAVELQAEAASLVGNREWTPDVVSAKTVFSRDVRHTGLIYKDIVSHRPASRKRNLAGRSCADIGACWQLPRGDRWLPKRFSRVRADHQRSYIHSAFGALDLRMKARIPHRVKGPEGANFSHITIVDDCTMYPAANRSREKADEHGHVPRSTKPRTEQMGPLHPTWPRPVDMRVSRLSRTWRSIEGENAPNRRLCLPRINMLER